MLTFGHGLARVLCCPQPALEVEGLQHTRPQIGGNKVGVLAGGILQHLQQHERPSSAAKFTVGYVVIQHDERPPSMQARCYV